MTPKIRVVLADDHAVVRKGIRQFLEEAGDTQVVAEANDGAEALRLIEEDPPDVAVLDSARFRYLLSQHCGVDVHNVHAYVLGEFLGF